MGRLLKVSSAEMVGMVIINERAREGNSVTPLDDDGDSLQQGSAFPRITGSGRQTTTQVHQEFQTLHIDGAQGLTCDGPEEVALRN